MTETAIFALAATMCTAMLVVALFRAWQGWLTYKEQELAAHLAAAKAGQASRLQSELNTGFGLTGLSPAQDSHNDLISAKIEISDLRERIRKLEAIANGVEL